MKYSIRTVSPSGLVAYIRHRDKTAWCKRTATKYMRDFLARFGGTAKLEEA